MTLPPKNAVFRISRREKTYFALRRRILFQNPRAGHDPPLQVFFDKLSPVCKGRPGLLFYSSRRVDFTWRTPYFTRRQAYITVPPGTYTSMMTGRIMGLRLVVL